MGMGNRHFVFVDLGVIHTWVNGDADYWVCTQLLEINSLLFAKSISLFSREGRERYKSKPTLNKIILSQNLG